MSAVIVGFYGKVPARGDFVRSGLPRDFTDPWDAWLAQAIAGSRARMGEDWLPAFLEAPVWRFVLAPGLCGERAVLGLVLPSVDRAGRYFPLTFAALFDEGPAVADAAWLDQCEAAGRAALELDTAPEEIGAMLGVPAATPSPLPWSASQPEPANGGGAVLPSQSLWWTEGAPRVPATHLVISGMPDACVYATMLDAATAGHADQAATAAQTTKAWDPVSETPTGGDPWEPPS